MRGELLLLAIDIAVGATFVYWIALEQESPDWLFILPHTVFAILLFVAAGLRPVKAKTGALIGAVAYAVILLWALGLISYIMIANPRQGEHLGAYAMLLGMFGAVFTFLNAAALRSARATPERD